ncbi:MAG: D-tyrosyl-tRNA(Tyr) deacylase [Gammaproteobacteria bacterium]|jgi:D-tyrosyl-tRNA(Tyr) deacylase|nr:D-tyrosyl-tRNA(Tyr) deacylase [Gammaproteobacteria bacterium]MBT3722265.1 D-tyrosyl-tRNA(Tyr) deacylase [Gammaproteobacteria bacterium]MBT4076363.1 D-tyrosyl-tRNA(Tyr) deacylase [Gammaproteobacteria bacterium]MBT4193639.1 D-tyrosyl-tRNA(Tyr) deacylase [Gammaproteobacteria bacterium]MBT4450609.1 D-tyrosyl-tRNA(Tyr) deacylase [Gammaproteobacteria bacterium]
MIVLLQRVRQARVEVEKQIVGQINQGLLVFVGFEPEDNETVVSRMLERLLNYRVFADQDDKMNLSVRDIQGGLLLVPQFTLAANTTKGRRPSFTSAAAPEKGLDLFEYLLGQAVEKHETVSSGRFGADMQVHLQNDGPVTFLLK